MTVDVTLIVPSYQGEAYIAQCLDSIMSQTLERSRFEVLVVVNGNIDRVPHIVDETFRSEPGLNYSVIYDEYASLSNARNVGIDLANGSWVTWVDVDDWISPNFLEEMATAASAGCTPLAKVVDVSEDSATESQSPITEQMLQIPPGQHSPAKLWRSLGFAACKLLPTELARKKKFDVNLRSGEDVAYFAPFYAENELEIDNRPAHNGATYFRLVRSGSMSRQEPTFQFSVSDRLAVMKHLDAAAVSAPEDLRTVMHGMMRSQTLFGKRYLDDHPDRLEDIISEYDRADLQYTPWNLLAGRTNNLAISYNFLPSADASAVVAAKRIMATGQQWNVICNDMSTVRANDPDFYEKVLPYISTQKTIRNPAIFGSWKGVTDFCEAGLDAIDEIERNHGKQTVIYSRSMWPASHYLAGLHKLRNPDIRWTAEFSDPLRKDVNGHERVGAIVSDSVWDELALGIQKRGFALDPSQGLFANCEKIAYALSDSIYFTNPHQMSYMLSYLDDLSLRDRVSEIASVHPQPRPSNRLFVADRVAHVRDPSCRVEIGFFGSFYPNRGVGILTQALGRVPERVRSKVRLNLYTPSSESLESEISDLGLRDVIVVRPQLPYLDFLGEASRMDYLLITDAETALTGHRLNPYLPSKLSDYLGTGRPIWALYEPGSMLSRSNLSLMDRSGDLEQIVNTLSKMVVV